MTGQAKGIPATVEQGEEGVEITFSDEIPRDLIESQVRECQNGTCQCCTPAFRKNVDSFEIIPGKKLRVKVTGNITKEQIIANIMSCMPKLGMTD